MPAETNASRETTKFSGWVILLVSLPVVLVLAVLFANALLHHEKTDLLILGGLILLTLAVAVLLSNHSLLLIIDETGICFRYRPYVLRKKCFSWADIKSARIVKYEPISDFMGWGLKKSRKYGNGYTTRGSTGLAITLRNGERFMFTVIDIEQAGESIKIFQPGINAE